MCRQAGYHKHALFLAKSHGDHHWVLKILLEDVGDYEQGLRYMTTLPILEAEANMLRYGKTLIDNVSFACVCFVCGYMRSERWTHSDCRSL